MQLAVHDLQCRADVTTFWVTLLADSEEAGQLCEQEEEVACTPAPRPAGEEARRLVDQFCAQVQKPLDPILDRPNDRVPPASTRRPRQKRPPISSPRRSVRLAKGPGQWSAGSKQQQILIRKLCLANEAEVITDEALQAYVGLF